MPLQSDTQSKIHLNTYPEHRRKFASRLVANLPIHTESRGVERNFRLTPCEGLMFDILRKRCKHIVSENTRFNMDPPRRDSWWIEPFFTAIGLLAFVVYSTWAAFQNELYQ